ncbi:MAG: C1 family peptidase, partial [Methanosarcina vacuolata]|nr:C1 family peptidase [Methanosarcina vacuolata]
MKKNLNIKSDLNVRKTAAIFCGLLVLLLVAGSSIAMADTGLSENSKALEPGLAPVNPDFIKYQQAKTSNQLEPSDGHGTGFIPSTVDLSHLSPISYGKVSFPAYYDLRTLNKVTPVKDQGNAGTCWAFATYGSLESYLMPGKTWDFSENNLKNLLSPKYSNGFDFPEGGNSFMSTAYLARWSGPIDEKDDPYDPDSEVSPEDKTVKKHVQNVLFLPYRQ